MYSTSPIDISSKAIDVQLWQHHYKQIKVIPTFLLNISSSLSYDGLLHYQHSLPFNCCTSQARLGRRNVLL